MLVQFETRISSIRDPSVQEIQIVVRTCCPQDKKQTKAEEKAKPKEEVKAKTKDVCSCIEIEFAQFVVCFYQLFTCMLGVFLL